MQTRLTRLTLRGFKTIQNLADFEPGDLTILIGPNGAGKSNFISFFRLLSFSLNSPGQLQLFVGMQGGASKLLHDGPGVTPHIDAMLTLRTDKAENHHGFRLSHAAGDTCCIQMNGFTISRTEKTGSRQAWGRGIVRQN